MKTWILWVVFALAASALFGTYDAQGQSWVTVAHEGDTVAASAPITYRFGTPAGVAPADPSSTPCVKAGGCWDPAVTGAGSISVTVATFGGVDPAYGTAKILQVLQTTADQAVTDQTSAGSSTVTIPAWTPIATFHFEVNVNGYSIKCDLGPADDGTMTNVACAVDQPTSAASSLK